MLEVDALGYVVTNDEMATSLEGVYSIGDVRAKKMRQVSTAVGDGGSLIHDIDRYFRERA